MGLGGLGGGGSAGESEGDEKRVAKTLLPTKTKNKIAAEN